jgi:hypothetical protein
MNVLIIITTAVVSIPIGAIISAVLVHKQFWKLYPKVYRHMQHKKFYKLQENIVASIDKNFLWYTNNNNIQLGKEVYLENNIITHLDPISYYWHRKFVKWLKEHIEVNTL